MKIVTWGKTKLFHSNNSLVGKVTSHTQSHTYLPPGPETSQMKFKQNPEAGKLTERQNS